MELLTENANLSRKIALLEQDSSSETTNHQHANEENPWKKELTIAEQKNLDLQQVLRVFYDKEYPPAVYCAVSIRKTF